MKVNVFWQSMATLLIPTGLFCFKRIDKLRSGIFVYMASFGVMILSYVMSIMMFMTNDGSYNLVIGTYSIGVASLSYIIPIYYIRKWSLEYNKKIGKENITSAV